MSGGPRCSWPAPTPRSSPGARSSSTAVGRSSPERPVSDSDCDLDSHSHEWLNRPMVIRVVQWATGGVGKAAIQGVLAHPDLELVGAWVHSEAKHGVDLGELVGL